MTCDTVLEKVHDYLDQQLPASESSLIDRHLETCAQCSTHYAQFSMVRELLAERAPLCEVSSEQLWKRIQARRQRSVAGFIGEQWKRLYTYWRDLDSRVLWSKLAAFPVAVCFFLLIMAEFPPLQSLSIWTLPVVEESSVVFHLYPHPLITEVKVQQRDSEINGLASTVWNMPYEDSLSVVAEITPQGYGQIEQVLEYPRSDDLLQAVSVALRRSHFERARSLSSPVLIYSLQKIDVYGQEAGM